MVGVTAVFSGFRDVCGAQATVKDAIVKKIRKVLDVIAGKSLSLVAAFKVIQ